MLAYTGVGDPYYLNNGMYRCRGPTSPQCWFVQVWEPMHSPKTCADLGLQPHGIQPEIQSSAQLITPHSYLSQSCPDPSLYLRYRTVLCSHFYTSLPTLCECWFVQM